MCLFQFTCDPTVLQEVKTKLEGRGLAVETYMENFDPLVLATPTEAEQEEIDSITERLENIENFVRLYTNLASWKVKKPNKKQWIVFISVTNIFTEYIWVTFTNIHMPTLLLAMVF